ncbi:MAG: carotenoid biosynthesis protein [Calditrichae bacterium]|nr:carotenoid biosynthesis protein [Calditrichia bacterium]
MQHLAGPMIVGLSIWLFWEYNCSLTSASEKFNPLQVKFYLWSLAVISGSIVIEIVGAASGLIFGDYAYGNTLQPQVADVPLAIGFAWFSMLLSATAVVQSIFRRSALKMAGMVAFSMVIFDIVMEPAAVELRYWHWTTGNIPLQNYVAWFIISFFFSLFSFRMGLFQEKLSSLTFHAFFAQLGYFGMVILR